MISKATATQIALAYREIEASEKLIEDVAKAMDQFGTTDLRDVFGRRVNGLQLGVPSGNNGHRLFDLPFSVAQPVIEAHIAQQRAVIAALTEKALGEVAAARGTA
jgi:hypothetical protein